MNPIWLVGNQVSKRENHEMPYLQKGETAPGTATVTLQRDGLTLIVKEVPAQVCDNCGEEYVDERTTAELLAKVESEARARTEINVRHFQTA
jgi:YgiT-type zinc finger domain-containing protein